MFLNKKTNYHELSTHDDAIGQFFLSKMLGIRYGPVRTRFLWFYGPDDNFRWFYGPDVQFYGPESGP